MSFLKNVIKETGNEYGTIVSDGLATADVSGYVGTGSFIFIFEPVEGHHQLFRLSLFSRLRGVDFFHKK